MLIRSKDKKRIANIENCSLIAIVGSCTLQNITVDGMLMATYSTEEKAIKVLDMIQETYKGNRVEEVYHEGSDYFRPVFQMPQDSEV